MGGLSPDIPPLPPAPPPPPRPIDASIQEARQRALQRIRGRAGHRSTIRTGPAGLTTRGTIATRSLSATVGGGTILGAAGVG